MKNTRRSILGIIAILTVIGFVMIACELGSVGGTDSTDSTGNTGDINGTGSSPTRPAAPTGVNLTWVDSDYYTATVRITWNPVPGATRYNVYYAYNSPYSAKIFAGSASRPPFTFTLASPSPGSAWYIYYWVTAVNSAGESDF